MELLSIEWFSALLSIIIIDLVLAGDNAIVIGMAARNVPKDHQRMVILLGTAGAVIVRVLATFAIVWLLKIPGLHLVGGILLVYIAYKLLAGDTANEGDNIKANNGVMAAIGTIILADMAMGLDNVIAVAGAAGGEYILVVIGLLISIPLVVWGSTMIVKLMDRFPWVILLGAGVLALTAGKMITTEGFLLNYFANPFVKWGFTALVIVLVLWLGGRGKTYTSKKS